MVSLANMGQPTFRRLGRSGLAVSATGLGCNNLGRPNTVTESAEGVQALIDAALDAGVTLFDVADIYGTPHGRSEELLGAALGARRADVIVATKFGMEMHGADGPDFQARGSRWYVRRAVENSLRRLQTDWIDLYQLHQPDPATPIEETLAALDELVAEGKVRYVGHSNFAGWQVADAAWRARVDHRTPFISAQNEYSLLNRTLEAEVMPAAREFAWACCRSTRWPTACSRASTPAGTRRREPAAGDQAATAGDRPLGPAGPAPDVRRRARRHHAAGRVRLAAGAGARGRGDRRSDHAGADPRQRRGGHGLDAHRRGPRRDRRDLPGPGPV